MPRHTRNNAPRKNDSNGRTRNDDATRMMSGRANDHDRETRQGKNANPANGSNAARKSVPRTRNHTSRSR
jgi:hypothetical protein